MLQSCNTQKISFFKKICYFCAYSDNCCVNLFQNRDNGLKIAMYRGNLTFSFNTSMCDIFICY